MKKLFLILLVFLQVGCASDSYYYQNNEKVNLTPMNNYINSIENVNYFSTDKGIVLGVSDKILVKLKKTATIDTLLSKYDLTLEKKFTSSLYLVKASNKVLTLDKANELTQDESVLYAEPDFIKEKISR